MGRCKQNVKLSKGARPGGGERWGWRLEWAEVLTLPQKAQALGFLDALGMWRPG